MYQEEKAFTLRFSLEASFPDDYEGDEDHQAWVGSANQTGSAQGALRIVAAAPVLAIACAQSWEIP